MFRKRTTKNLNRKKVEDIKDAFDSGEEKHSKNETNTANDEKKVEDIKDAVGSGEEKHSKNETNTTNDESPKEKSDEHRVKKREGKEKDSDEDVDVVCKFLIKKKKLNEEKLPHVEKYNRRIHVKSYDEKKDEENGNDNYLTYKGENVESKDVGSYAVDTDIKYDHRSVLERNIKICEDIQKGKLKENVYRGIGAHEKAINIKKDNLSKNKYTGLYGPVRSSGTNVRMTLRIDYEPCICKDYKETGYCGFGDTCIFLHDRSDYKSGWRIEQEYEQKRKTEEALQKKKLEKSYKKMLKKMEKKENMLKTGVSDNANMEEYNDSDSSESVSEASKEKDSCDSCSSDDEQSLPFACLSCKKKWNMEMNPSVTECMHYFCEKCFIEMFQKSKKCIQCGQQLSGIMNSATKVIELLNKKQAHIK